MGVEHLPAQPIEELLEAAAGIRLEEVVLRQAADLATHVRGKGLDLRLATGGQLGGQLTHLARIARGLGLGLGRLTLFGRRAGRQPPLDAPPFRSHDLLELLAHVGQDVRELVPSKRLLSCPV